jgi:hypothetical protein
MHSNSIWSEGKVALVEAFSNNPNLRIVDLNDNWNSSEETRPMALALAKALPNWPHLTAQPWVFTFQDRRRSADCRRAQVRAHQAGRALPRRQRDWLRGGQIDHRGRDQ